jgi:hypothetical protein
MSVARIITKKTTCPLNRYLDKAKAAIELINKVIKVATIVTNTELLRHLTASKLPKAFLVKGSV